MLVRLTDIKGNEVWVNPAYVRYVRPHAGKTEVMIPVPSKWGIPGPVLTDTPVETVVELLNASMPGFFTSAPYDLESDEEQQRRRAAAQ